MSEPGIAARPGGMHRAIVVAGTCLAVLIVVGGLGLAGISGRPGAPDHLAKAPLTPITPAGSSLAAPGGVPAAKLPTPAVAPPLVVKSVTPSSANIDPGQSVPLRGNATGGTPPYGYQWYRGNYQQCQGDVNENVTAGFGANLSVSSAYGSAYYCYTVTDNGSPPQSGMPSQAVLVTVEPGLSAGAVTPFSVTIDNGTTIPLTAHPQGGTGTYTVTWTSSVIGTPFCTFKLVGTGLTTSVTPSQNTSYCYTVNDTSVGTPSAGNTSAPDLITVDPSLHAGKVTPISPTADAGQFLLLSAAPSGGTGPGTYTVQWYTGSGSTCSNTLKKIGRNLTTTYVEVNLSTGFCYSVTDASYHASTFFSSMDAVAVSNRLSAGPVTPTSPFVDLNQTLKLTAPTPSGGTSPYTYQWYYSEYSNCSAATATPLGGQTGTTLTVTPGGSQYYCYAVTDSANGSSPETSFSAGDLVTVDQPLQAGPIQPTAPTIDANSSVILTANPLYGTPSYSGYKWYSGTNSTCSGDQALSNTTQTITVRPIALRFYCYSVTDASVGSPQARVNSPTDQVRVDSSLVAGPVSPAAPTIDKGQSILLSANPSGGTPDYSFQWYNGTSCSTLIRNATAATYLAHPTSNTTYCYTLSDGSANPPTKGPVSDLVTVAPALSPGSPSPKAPGIDKNQYLNLSAGASGGKRPFTFQWYSGSNSTCADDTARLGTASYQNVTPKVNTYYCYSVTDSAYAPSSGLSSTVLVRVNQTLSAGAVTSASTVLDVGESAVLSANPVNGTPQYRYVWFQGPSANCALDTTQVPKGTTAKVIATPKNTTLAMYYCYVVRDSSVGTPAAVQTSGTYKLVVNLALANGMPLPNSQTINQGTPALLVANVSGGTLPLTYQWYSSSSTTCDANSTELPGQTAPFLNLTPSSTAYYCVWVSDVSNGVPSSASFSAGALVFVLVPPAPTFLGFPEEQGIIVLAVLVGVCALAGFLIFWRIKRGKRRGPSTDFL